MKFGQLGRIRVKLTGHTIFGGSGADLVFLDGQSFGQPGVRADRTQRIDLQFPSGSGERASAFESWFYLAPAGQIASVTLDHSQLRVDDAGQVWDTSQPAGTHSALLGRVPYSLQATVQLTYPAIADTAPISVSIIPPPGVDGGLVTVQDSVTIPRGQTATTVPVILRGNPGQGAHSFGVFASLPLAVGSSTQQTTLTVSGF
jgi:hypothetical protein